MQRLTAVISVWCRLLPLPLVIILPKQIITTLQMTCKVSEKYYYHGSMLLFVPSIHHIHEFLSHFLQKIIYNFCSDAIVEQNSATGLCWRPCSNRNSSAFSRHGFFKRLITSTPFPDHGASASTSKPKWILLAQESASLWLPAASSGSRSLRKSTSVANLASL